MAKRIKVRGIARSEPDMRLYAVALIELARQLQAEELSTKESAEASAKPPAEAQESAHD